MAAAELHDAATAFTAADVIPTALAAGALSAAEVVQLGVMVELVGRSHAVFRISVGGAPRFFLKAFGPRRGATDGIAEREEAVQALAQSRLEVAALVPPAWPWDRARVPARGLQWVAAAAVAGAEAWTADEGGTHRAASAWHELMDALLPKLAAFHRATRDLARPGAELQACLAPECPWGLRVMDGDAPAELWAGPVTGLLLREAARDTVFVAACRSVRTLWRHMALIHADLKHDNLILERSNDGVKVMAVDWEMARVGDPAWDLACLGARLAVLRQEGPPWNADEIDAIAYMVKCYASLSGLAVPALAQRVLGYAGAVLLMASLQHGSTLSPSEPLDAARSLLSRSRSTLHRLAGLTDALLARTANAG